MKHNLAAAQLAAMAMAPLDLSGSSRSGSGSVLSPAQASRLADDSSMRRHARLMTDSGMLMMSWHSAERHPLDAVALKALGQAARSKPLRPVDVDPDMVSLMRGPDMHRARPVRVMPWRVTN